MRPSVLLLTVYIHTVTETPNTSGDAALIKRINDVGIKLVEENVVYYGGVCCRGSHNYNFKYLNYLSK